MAEKSGIEKLIEMDDWYFDGEYIRDSNDDIICEMWMPTVFEGDEGNEHILDRLASESQWHGNLIEKLPEIFNALHWMTRCASIKGPAGTTAYIISEERMSAARELVDRFKPTAAATTAK